MHSIDSLGHPLVFAVAGQSSGRPVADRVLVRTDVRALRGMQKEALVRVGGGREWRMVSDEGPYLNGTDLAPFPLAFFAAGVQFSLISQLVQVAAAKGVLLGSVATVQDTFYTMEGSFLRGDATGGARAIKTELDISADAPVETMSELVRSAVASSGGHALMRDPLVNRFFLTYDGKRSAVAGLPASPSPGDRAPSFDRAVPDPAHPVATDIITKIALAARVHGVPGGAGSSLRSEQKRSLHVRGEARYRDGMPMTTDIRLFKPIGSSFRFMCDEIPERGGEERAPPPLAYLGAGIGFCYMTQLGRYAHIRKTALRSYAVTQTNGFTVHESPAADAGSMAAEPVDTHVFLEADLDREAAADFVRTGERTCFLHAAMRGSYPSGIALRVNGSDVAV